MLIILKQSPLGGLRGCLDTSGNISCGHLTSLALILGGGGVAGMNNSVSSKPKNCGRFLNFRLLQEVNIDNFIIIIM